MIRRANKGYAKLVRASIMCCSIEKVAEGTYIVPTVNTIEILIKLTVQ